VKAAELQQWLSAHGQPVTPDGQIGPRTRTALNAVFTNACVEAVTSEQIKQLATRLGCTVKQLRAVAKVESGGSGFDKQGRPKILFERHVFHGLTNGVATPCSFSMQKGGGYDGDSWEKLGLAAAVNVAAAFASCSWGKFQVLGRHWNTLQYPSAVEMAYSTVTGEAAHYEMLARYIEANRLLGALRALSSDPATNRGFARAYNGPAFRTFAYDTKLADAMA